ncbi:NADH-quinone oxidoreductase subunit C [Streptomyces hirsutus]|uniref:NADH-quinone oxidoreductase subunit C n=1 Tax=Streptomyces hirsutus TaxID=35620 RepID=UPI00386EC0D3|nr:NADH-quinone oxidoreductase subunit C [Streptomyces hirsutus]
MTAAGWLPADAEELFGTEATAEDSYDVLTVDVPPASWLPALETARDRLDCTYFDWLSAVDEPGTGFRVTAHVVALSPVRRLLLRTTVPHEAPTLPSAVGVYAGAAWHERETHEMFGVDFTGHPALDHLLLPDTFEGHPLRKDFVLAARVAKAWPGAKEPGEPEQGGPKRRQMLPPGVPDPNEWGPLKGQLPPAPSRPARGAGRAATGTGPAAGRAPGDRPLRRTRTAAEGSASQSAPAGTEGEGRPAPPPRRNRTAAEGSASQQAARTPEPPAADTAAQSGTPPPATPRTRRARSASEGSASQRERSTAAASKTSEEAEKAAEDTVGSAAGPGSGTDAPEAPAVGRRTRSASEGSASQRPQASPSKPTDERRPRRTRSASEGSASRPTTPPDAAGTPDTTGGPDTTTSPDTTGTSKETEAPDRTGASGAKPSTAPRSPDAPWHHARQAHAEPEPDAADEPEAEPEPEAESEAEARTEPESAPAPAPDPDPESGSSDPGAPDTPSGGPR